MWSLKYKVKNLDSTYTVLTGKYKVVDYFYPLDHYRKGKKIYIFGVHLLEGEEIEKERFSRELKNNKKTKEFEKQGNQIIALIEEEEDFYELFYSAEIYHPSPILIQEGYELCNVACYNRNILERTIKEIEKNKNKFENFQLLNLGKSDLRDIYFPKIIPQLPEKQQAAFELALKRGYYTWPRKIDLVGLAKESKVSVATFQENLRKAEAKLLPFFSENLKLK